MKLDLSRVLLLQRGAYKKHTVYKTLFLADLKVSPCLIWQIFMLVALPDTTAMRFLFHLYNLLL